MKWSWKLTRLAGSETVFPVRVNGQMVGVLTQSDLLKDLLVFWGFGATRLRLRRGIEARLAPALHKL